MKQGLRLIESTLQRTARPAAAPTFLVTLEPWPRVFLRNLRDLFWPRRQAQLRLSSPPAQFWPDVFVVSRLPWGRFAESAVFHTAVIMVLWSAARLWPQPRQVMAAAVFHRSDVIYYQADDLPALDTREAEARPLLKGDPVYAPQPIISVPPEADNHRQTIVTPPPLKLKNDVPLPNIVAWSGPEPVVPLAATAGRTSELKPPTLPTPVIAPPPEVSRSVADRAPKLPETVIAPAPEVSDAPTQHNVQGPQAAVVEPPPRVETGPARRLSDINIGRTQVVAPAPQLPMGEQQTFASRAVGSLGNPPAAVVPPPPSVQGTGVSESNGRLIALSVSPARPDRAVEMPNGNRRGVFAATPEGRAGATATPDTPTGNSPTEHGTGHDDKAAARKLNGIPSGLYVGTSGGAAAPTGDPTLIAHAAPPRTVASEMPPEQRSDEEQKIFGVRRSYAMTLNFPNLNSAGGSLVMHFSELQDGVKQGELFAPVTTRAVAPGYPLELMRENVQGMVTLTAVIRADGSVDDVRIVKSVDDRLDEYARKALLRWQFLPALRNGNPVALQAVVMIPFRPTRKPGF